MEEMFSDKAFMSPDNFGLPADYHSVLINSGEIPFRNTNRLPAFGSDELLSAATASAVSEAASFTPDDDTSSTAIKAKIASHPRYARLIQAYIDCHKVGAPPEIARIFDEIRRESDVCRLYSGDTRLGADPELDEFMDTFCELLDKCKSDLARPLDEATSFLNEVETQLRNLCNGAFVRTASDEGVISSDEEYSGGEANAQELLQRDDDRDLKDQLLRKFGSHISSLKLEFSKKKKKGKLPREARQLLFEWWNAHYKWPYPTEADKTALAEATGLDQRQINNWFINQRKRHWKPSENMEFALMDNLSGHYFTAD